MKRKKICCNGKKWGSNNSYQNSEYQIRMRIACFKGNTYLDNNGYLLTVEEPIDWTKPVKRIHVHRLMMEQYLGRKLTTDETVHHNNQNKLDNRIENFTLFATKNQHNMWHAMINRFKKFMDARALAGKVIGETTLTRSASGYKAERA